MVVSAWGSTTGGSVGAGLGSTTLGGNGLGRSVAGLGGTGGSGFGASTTFLGSGGGSGAGSPVLPHDSRVFSRVDGSTCTTRGSLDLGGDTGGMTTGGTLGVVVVTFVSRGGGSGVVTVVVSGQGLGVGVTVGVAGHVFNGFTGVCTVVVSFGIGFTGVVVVVGGATVTIGRGVGEVVLFQVGVGEPPGVTMTVVPLEVGAEGAPHGPVIVVLPPVEGWQGSQATTVGRRQLLSGDAGGQVVQIGGLGQGAVVMIGTRDVGRYGVVLTIVVPGV